MYITEVGESGSEDEAVVVVSVPLDSVMAETTVVEAEVFPELVVLRCT